jgi:hypothetical protein
MLSGNRPRRPNETRLATMPAVEALEQFDQFAIAYGDRFAKLPA